MVNGGNRLHINLAVIRPVATLLKDQPTQRKALRFLLLVRNLQQKPAEGCSSPRCWKTHLVARHFPPPLVHHFRMNTRFFTCELLLNVVLHPRFKATPSSGIPAGESN